MNGPSCSGLLENWENLEAEYKSLEELHKEYEQKAVEVKKLQGECLVMLQKYQQKLTDFHGKTKTVADNSDARIKTLNKEISNRKVQIRDIDETLPKKNGLYLNIILGNVNVSLLSKSDRFKYKDEYERFKLILTVCCLTLSVIALVFHYRFIDALLHYLLVWYYSTLSVRESILRVNGSRIKGWWLAHHYISLVLSGIVITWPDGVVYREFRNQFMWFAMYLTFVQIMQYQYQKGCLYRLRALGERHHMDITVDGFHAWMWKGLTFLLPLLFLGYAFQTYNAYTLYHLSYHPQCAEWQVFLLSIIFLVLATGNTLTTLQVVQQKISQRLSKRKDKSQALINKYKHG